MTIAQLNSLPGSELRSALERCCGSPAWVQKMYSVFPVADEQTLWNEAEKNWFACSEDDWREAFAHHPKIGDIASLKQKFAATAQWAGSEQSGIKGATTEVLEALAEGNKLYEEKFGYIFIVCATGKPAEEMLHLLQSRLSNPPEKEILVAMQEQNKITRLRLQKLLEP